MVKNKKYIITRSNYTVKKKHKSLDSNRTVYERDFMVTGNNNWEGNNSSYGISSFKMVRNIKNDGRYRYNSGEWLKQNTCNETPEIWTSNCVNNEKEKNSENHIELIPNYNSLLDFAYYRSCKDLIQTSINDIINNFPGELYFSSLARELDDEEDVIIYDIENTFSIDIYTKSFKKIKEKNFRLLLESFDDYVIIKPNGVKSKIKRIDVEDHGVKIACAEDWDMLFTTNIVDEYDNNYVIDIYYLNGDIIYTFDDSELIGLRIHPNDEKIETFFKNLDRFQKIMLNRDSYPLYTMYLDYPHETDKGIETYKKYFTWPVTSEGKWNLDINSGEYEIYIKDLLELCDFYDTRRTDNLWRIMTHDSIKNMDYAFKNDNIEDNEYGLGESKFEKIIKCYAKQFDDIKQYIDNIKSVNKITYDKSSNTPNYFLSDKLELNGWEVYNMANSLNENSKVNSNKLFNNVNKLYTVSDVNINLMKNLQINSRDILSRKGTKHGIEMLMGLFGLTSYDHNKSNYDYKISEYVDTVVDNSKVDYATVIKYNKQKINYEEVYPAYGSAFNDPLQNLPLRLVNYKNDDDTSGNYLIPWIDKNQTLDGNIYFQMYGGWCKTFKKGTKGSTKMGDDIITSDGITIYDETVKYLLLVKNLNDIKYINKEKLYDGCIVYVTNINNFDDIYKNDDIKTITLNGDNNTLKASNYFILDDIRNYFIIGSDKDTNGNNIYGWENITIKEIEDSSNKPNNNRGLRVRLMESVIEDHKGNNPHGGYGKYDDGETFVNFFKQIFKYSIENDNFNDILYRCEDGKLDENIINIGFDIEKQKDNVKTWYFSDTTIKSNIEDSLGGLLELTNVTETHEDTCSFMGVDYLNVKCSSCIYTSKQQEEVNIGVNNNFSFYESELKPFDFEKIGKSFDESTANSIINDKKLLIEFSGPITTHENFPLFLQNGILPYLKQMIPSTSILEIAIEGGYAGYTTLPYASSNLEEEINN